MKINFKQKSFFYNLAIIQLFLLGFFAFILTYISFNNPHVILSIYLSNFMVISVFVICIFFWNLFFPKEIIHGINNYIFLGFLFFLGSESFLKILQYQSKGVFSHISVKSVDLVRANFLIILGVIFYSIGAFLINHKKIMVKFKLPRELISSKVGWVIFIIGIISFGLDFEISWLYSSYRNFDTNKIYSLIWMNFLPISGFVLLANEKHKKKGLAILNLLVLFYLVKGNRGYAISLLLTTFWAYNLSWTIPDKKKLFKGLIIFLIVILLIFVFQNFKSATVIEKTDLDNYKNIDFKNAFISVLIEGSVTYRTLVHTVQYIPENKNFDLGKSYLWGATTVFPNIFSDNHPATSLRKSPSEWFKWTFNPIQAEKGQGYGFNIISEAYYNFGIYGVMFIMLFLGVFITKLSIWSQVAKSNMVITSLLLHNIFWGIRNTFQSIIRSIIWEISILIVIYLLLNLLSKAFKLNNS